MNVENVSGIHPYIKPLIWGVIWGSVTIIALIAIASLIIANLEIPIPSVPLIVTICGGVGTFVAGFVSAKIMRRKGLIIGFLTGLMFLVVLFVSTLTFSGDAFNAETITKFIVLLVAALLGGMLGVNSKKRR